jgi:hypothetical protein
MPEKPTQRLLVGAPAIAEYVLGTKKKARKMYQPKVRKQLGLFLFGGQLAGRPTTIDERISAAERAAGEGANEIAHESG